MAGCGAEGAAEEGPRGEAAVGGAAEGGAAGGSAPWDAAIRLLDEMELRGLPASVRAHNAAIELRAAACDAAGARWLLERMERRGLQPDGYSYTSAMKACGRAADAAAAAELLERAESIPRRRGGQRQWLERVYSGAALCFAAQPVGQAPLADALSLLDRMRRSGVRPTAHTYSALLRACSRHGGGREASALLCDMRRLGFAPPAEQRQFALRASHQGVLAVLETHVVGGAAREARG